MILTGYDYDDSDESKNMADNVIMNLGHMLYIKKIRNLEFKGLSMRFYDYFNEYNYNYH